jgi:hypothetical protein
MKRGGALKPVSARRRAQRSEREKILDDKVRGRFCQAFWRGDCRGSIVGHELVKRSAKRDAHVIPGLVVPLCWFHNGWVEDNPRSAQRAGLSVPGWYYEMAGEMAIDEAAQLCMNAAKGKVGRPSWWPPDPSFDEAPL